MRILMILLRPKIREKKRELKKFRYVADSLGLYGSRLCDVYRCKKMHETTLMTFIEHGYLPRIEVLAESGLLTPAQLFVINELMDYVKTGK